MRTSTDATAPTITHTPVTSWKAGTGLRFSATVSDTIGVQTVTLSYRTTGGSTYTALGMTATGSTYTSPYIPGTAVTKTGIDYYLEARDAAGKVRRLPNTAPGTPYGVVVGTTAFTDDPLGPRTTAIKAAHFTELLTAINALRTTQYSLPAYAWTGTAPAPGGAVRASHLSDLRTALDQAYAAAVPPKTHAPYTDPTLTARGTPIKAIHLSELRMHVRALE